MESLPRCPDNCSLKVSTYVDLGIVGEVYGA
jgi:hypothetical protein